MEKLMTKNVLNKLGFLGAVFVAAVGFPLIFASNASAQLPAPAPQGPGPSAEVERVIVTGSNIPTAEETGPNPVDTYRPQDIEKLGIRNATDLTTFIPQEAGGTINQNIANGGDGTVQLNLRGLLPKETLILVDGKRVAISALFGGYDIQLIPFSMIDHIDILKDGASAVYGADAVAGVVNFFLIHKFRGLEIGGTYGNTNLGGSNDMGEWQAWLKAGTGDDKTDIVVIADFYQRTGGLFSRDRDISSNGNFVPFGGFDVRSGNFPGRVQGLRLIPRLFFSDKTPTPHSSTTPAANRQYVNPFTVPGIIAGTPGDGDYLFFNFAAFTPALPPSDRQVFYGSFTRDICDKYLTVFADFKIARSFFDASLAAAPFTPDPFKAVNDQGQPTSVGFSPAGISVPIQNAFNPFTVGDTTLLVNGVPTPMTTGVRYRSLQDTGPRHEKFTYWDMLFDVGLKGEMGEFGDYFKTWNWELGFRYSRNEGEDISIGEVSQPGLRDALLDTDPRTAFNPFMGFFGRNTNAAIARTYVNLHNSATFEQPLAYATINGDLFNLPAGPVSFAIGGEYLGQRWTRTPDSLNTTFQSIGSTDREGARVNRDVWSIYEEIRVPFTSPTWNFPGFYSFEVDFAEREEWYSQNTTPVLSTSFPSGHTTYDAQKPKVSVRWQPIDPKYIGGLTLRGSYTEAFHAPTVLELNPAGAQSFPLVVDPFSTATEPQVEERLSGNPFLHPEVAYEWTYGAVYSPKWIKGLTVSADWWHIDLRDIVAPLGAQFIINNSNREPFASLVTRDPNTGAVTLVLDPNQNISGAIFEGLDYEAIYILDSTIFGGGDWGRLTTTINGTWLSRAELQPAPGTKMFGIAGTFLPTSFTLTSSLPRNRANFSLFYDGPADTWMGGLSVGGVVHWIGQYEDDNVSLVGTYDGGTPKQQTPRTDPTTGEDGLHARKVETWVTLDLLLNYTFNFPPPAPAEVPGFAKDGGKNVKMKDGKEKNVIPVSTAEYGCSNWKWWLNNTTVTLGMQNVADEDPPFVAGNFENGYDESLTTIKGRFWYVGLKKRF
jgi:iron complex outermembrane receptor protein